MSKAELEDRVRAALVADALEFGMTNDEARLYAVIAAKSLHAAGIRLSLTWGDLKRDLVAGLPRWLRRWVAGE